MQLTVVKKADDRSLGVKVMRISIGGFPDNAYLTYRGDLAEVKELLRDGLQVREEPPISPDDGKRYA